MYQGQVIMADDSLIASSALFAKPMQATQDYIANQVNNYVSSIGNAAGNIVQGVMDRFQEVRSATTAARVENMRNQLHGTWDTDMIRALRSVEEIQRAPVSMQRWVMAEPSMRTYYNRNGCSAYEGTYEDIRPGGVGPTHYDYRRVMNGVVHAVEDEEGKVTRRYVNYYEQLVSAEDVLSTIEKSSILATWDTLRTHISECDEDPTSELNEKLG